MTEYAVMVPAMPRGNPKRPTFLRLDPTLYDAVAATGMPLTDAIEEGLALWLARQKRKAAKPDRLAKHLAPPTAREIEARRTR
jgi:hypothetical protein